MESDGGIGTGWNTRGSSYSGSGSLPFTPALVGAFNRSPPHSRNARPRQPLAADSLEDCKEQNQRQDRTLFVHVSPSRAGLVSVAQHRRSSGTRFGRQPVETPSAKEHNTSNRQQLGPVRAAVNRRNLLRRHLKPTVKKLGLPETADFRSFRTMHSSLMSSVGVRPEVTRDNMGHATVDVTQNVYNRTWWEERVEAVSLAAASVWREFTPDQQPAR